MNAGTYMYVLVYRNVNRLRVVELRSVQWNMSDCNDITKHSLNSI